MAEPADTAATTAETTDTAATAAATETAAPMLGSQALLGGVEFRSRTLAYLKAIQQYGTFSQASAALHISQPAISQAIAAFEEQLGVPLLETQGRRKVLTDAGRQVAEFSTEVLHQAHELRHWLDSYTQGAAGSLRVGMVDTAVLYLVPAALEQYRSQHPQVELQVYVDESNTLLQRLQDFDLDLALVHGPHPPELASVEIATESLLLLAPQDESVQAWALPPTGSRTRTLIDRGLEQLDLTPHVTLESRNPAVLSQMAALGLAHAVLPAAIVSATPQLNQLRSQVVCQRSLLAAQRPPGGAVGGSNQRAEKFIELARQAASSS